MVRSMKQDSAEIPTSFKEAVSLVENYVLTEIQKETERKKLYYHTETHAFAVKNRVKIIFEAIAPALDFQSQPLALDRIKSLLELCAISHDMVQEFSPPDKPHASRKRLSGISESATATKLISYIESLNRTLLAKSGDSSLEFSNLDLYLLQDGISATICDRDPLGGQTEYSFSPNSIYQPYLYNSQSQQSIVGQIVALADLGTLGMEGIEAYLREGVLIFLEDNPDLVDLLSSPHSDLDASDRNLPTIKNRLLDMARFIVNLAKERQLRFEREIGVFNLEIQQILRNRVFKYLTSENIKKVEALTPTDENISLKELLNFFRLNN